MSEIPTMCIFKTHMVNTQVQLLIFMLNLIYYCPDDYNGKHDVKFSNYKTLI